jgi:protein phosphatase
VQKKRVALVLVADGVGGHGHGDWASQRCVETYRAAFESIDNLNDPEAFLKENAWTVAREVLRKGQDDPALPERGHHPDGLPGDRGRLLHHQHRRQPHVPLQRKKGLKRLTKDHSMVQEMIDAGTLTEEEALSHPYRARMTSAIGQPLEKIKMDVKGPYTLAPGDWLLSFPTACTTTSPTPKSSRSSSAARPTSARNSSNRPWPPAATTTSPPAC